MTKDEFKKLEEEHKKKLEEEYTFLDKKDYMKFEDCKEGFTYNIDGRNFSYGIFHNEQFYGIRHKFGDTFIDTEIHWDKDKHHGTVRPQKEIEKTPDEIMMALELEYNQPDTNFLKVYDYLTKFIE